MNPSEVVWVTVGVPRDVFEEITKDPDYRSDQARQLAVLEKFTGVKVTWPANTVVEIKVR